MSKYHIAIPDSRLTQLQAKLAATDFPDELSSADWDYGAPLADIKRLVHHWRNAYNWRHHEIQLNQLPNFHLTIPITNFGTIDLHYLHAPSPHPNAIPLLFCHGWPGNYLEVIKLLPNLTHSINNVSFHVVAPSLPNFGWSSGVSQRGFGLAQYAETCHRLMQTLGYKRYATQGGDWGFYITRAMGLLYPEAVLGSHVNMIRASPPRWTRHPWLALQHAVLPYTRREREGFARNEWFTNEGSGYRIIQCTKPQTPGYGLTDSPVALLAWIYEKLHDWTDDYPWTDDEILTWVSIYYFSTAGPAASLRIYYEGIHVDPEKGGVTRDRTQEPIAKVKLGLCHTPREITIVPSTWARTLGPVVLETFKKRGGHFAAYEIPDEIVADLRSMFGKGGGCYQEVGQSSPHP